MNGIWRAAICVCLTVGGVSVASGQEKAAGVPKVMQITREYVKPGRAGTAHDNTESGFVAAMRRAKWPTNYLGLASLSGKSRALFLTPYESFDAWQKDQEAVAKNATLSAALDRAYLADGELLEGLDQGVFYFDAEKSMNPHADLSEFRYFEFTVFHVKPGKDKEWEEVVKMAKAGYQKGIPDAHWGMFTEVYGGNGGTYLLITGHKTLAEIDKGFADDKKFMEAMGEEGMKKFSQMIGSSLESTSSQLFAVDPKMSYVKEEWIKADPGFWAPKAAPAAKAAAGEKKEKPKE